MIELNDIIRCSELNQDRQDTNETRWNMLKEIYGNNALIPFVGAGMSAPVFKTWKDALKSMVHGIPAAEAAIDNLLNKNDFEKAAAQIQKFLGNSFYTKVKEIFHISKLKEKGDVASSILPFVFNNGPVFTTNFERVIEECYGNDFDNVWLLSNMRFNEAVVNDVIRERKHDLFKIHGDIEDPASLVFTSEQCDNVYDYEEFTDSIEAICQKNVFLFLGCSCGEEARYKQIFKRVVEKSSHAFRNYAFLQLPEKKEETNDEDYNHTIAKRELDLSEWGVYPIWYPHADINHESVKVLLCSLSDDEPYDEIKKVLQEKLVQKRDGHPSFALMKQVEKELFAKVDLSSYSNNIPVGIMGTDDKQNNSVEAVIVESWSKKERLHFLLTGDGGMGKTVLLLSLTTDSQTTIGKCPAIYVPAFELDFSQETPIDNYIHSYLGYTDKDERVQQVHKLMEKKNGAPRLLLLLDGLNEISDTKQNLLRNHLQKWLPNNPGVQLIASSRRNDEDSARIVGSMCNLQLLRLSDTTIDHFLNRISVPLPTGKIRELVKSPLMLMLFSQSLLFDPVDSEFTIEKEDINQGKLIWNYLQIEEYNAKRRATLSLKDYYSSVIMCEHVAPAIAYEMTKRNMFQLTKANFVEIVKNIVTNLASIRTVQGLSERLLEIVQKAKNSITADDILDINDSLLLFRPINHCNSPVGSATYQIVHQNFRDCLAAIHIVNQSYSFFSGHEKALLLDNVFDSSILSFVGNIVGFSWICEAWKKANANRRSNKRITQMNQILDIVKGREKKEYRLMDFNNLNLKKYDLYRYKDEEDTMFFPKDNRYSQRTKVSKRTIGLKNQGINLSKVATSPDGERVVFLLRKEDCTTDDCLYVWNLTDGYLERKIRGVYPPAFIGISPNSEKLFALGGKEFVIWNIISGVEEYREKTAISIERKCDYIKVLFGKNNEVRLCIALMGRIYIWNTVEKTTIVLEYRNNKDIINDICISPDGKYVVTPIQDNILVWDSCKRGAPNRIFEKKEAEWVYVFFSSTDDHVLCCVSHGGDSFAWDLDTMQEVSPLSHINSDYPRITYEQRGFYIPDYDGVAFLHRGSMSLHAFQINYAFDAKKTSTVSSIDEMFQNVASEILNTIPEHMIDWGDNLALMNERKKVLIISPSYYMRLINLDTKLVEATLGARERRIDMVRIAANGERCASLLINDIMIWNIPQKRCERIVRSKNPFSIIDMEFTPNAEKMITLSEDGTLMIYNLKTGKIKQLPVINHHNNHRVFIDAEIRLSNDYCCVMIQEKGMYVCCLSVDDCFHPVEKDGELVFASQSWLIKDTLYFMVERDFYSIQLKTNSKISLNISNKQSYITGISSIESISPNGKLCIDKYGTLFDLEKGETHSWLPCDFYKATHNYTAYCEFISNKEIVFTPRVGGIYIYNIESGKARKIARRYKEPNMRGKKSTRHEWMIGTDETILEIKDDWKNVLRITKCKKGKHVVKRIKVISETYLCGLDMSRVRFSSRKVREICRQNGAIV